MFHELKKIIQELRQIIETLSILSSSNIQFWFLCPSTTFMSNILNVYSPGIGLHALGKF